MVIGGLIRDNVTSSESKVPFLGDIPLLGWLFKSKTTSIDKTNLMIFITPYIIKNEGEASALTERKNETLEDFRKEYHIEKKRAAPSVIPPKTGESAEQPAAVPPARMDIQEEPASELKTDFSTTIPQNGSNQGESLPPVEIKTDVTPTVQSPVESESPKEGAR